MGIFLGLFLIFSYSGAYIHGVQDAKTCLKDTKKIACKIPEKKADEKPM